MPPFLGGGDMISSVDLHTSRFAELPWKFEAGTSPIAEAVGLRAAVDFVDRLGMEAIREHETDLVAYALRRLAEMPGVDIHGPLDPYARGALVSFTVQGVHPHDVAEILGREGVCVRAGHHCTQPLMRRLGIPASVRASFAVHNTRDDVDRLLDALTTVREIFGS
jgi:cysteine desulfurase/selenocysteine lyase